MLYKIDLPFFWRNKSHRILLCWFVIDFSRKGDLTRLCNCRNSKQESVIPFSEVGFQQFFTIFRKDNLSWVFRPVAGNNLLIRFATFFKKYRGIFKIKF